MIIGIKSLVLGAVVYGFWVLGRWDWFLFWSIPKDHLKLRKKKGEKEWRKKKDLEKEKKNPRARPALLVRKDTFFPLNLLVIESTLYKIKIGDRIVVFYASYDSPIVLQSINERYKSNLILIVTLIMIFDDLGFTF